MRTLPLVSALVLLGACASSMGPSSGQDAARAADAGHASVLDGGSALDVPGSDASTVDDASAMHDGATPEDANTTDGGETLQDAGTRSDGGDDPDAGATGDPDAGLPACAAVPDCELALRALDAAPVQTTFGATVRQVVRVVALEPGYGVFWTGGASVASEELHYRRLDIDLTPIGTDTRVAPALVGSGNRFGAVHDGRDIGVLWLAAPPGEAPRPHFLRIDTSGVAIGMPIAIAPTAEDVALAWNGTRCGAVWSAGGDVLFRSLARDGAPIDAAITLTGDTTDASGTARTPDLAWNGTAYVVAWEDGRHGPRIDDSEIYAATITESGAFADPLRPHRRVSVGANRSFDPHVAASPCVEAISYLDGRLGDSSHADVFIAARASGTTYREIPLAIGEFTVRNAGFHALAARGHEVVASFSRFDSEASVNLTGLSADGMTAVAPVRLATGAGTSVVATTTNFVVAWLANDSAGQQAWVQRYTLACRP